MRDRDLAARAAQAGIAVQWTDAFGKRRRVASDTLRALLEALRIDESVRNDVIPPMLIVDAAQPVLRMPARVAKDIEHAHVELELGGAIKCGVSTDASGGLRLRKTLPPGYHRITLGRSEVILAAAPARCFGVADALREESPRAFGIAAQVYGLRRAHDLGVGNFGALAQLAANAARAGATALAISPVHAMFARDPHKYSPYSPSNRCFLNALHADPCALVDAAELARVVRTAGLDHEIVALRRARLIDWPRIAAVHQEVFRKLFARFSAGKIAGAARLADFRNRSGAALVQHARFEAGRSGDERFHEFLQWRAAADLAQAQTRMRAHGARIGLIADLAVGVDPSGSECAMRPREMLRGVSIGAPPDALAAAGQNWGLTTFSPFALVHNAYTAFLDVLRAAMRHAGGVRIDHVMSLLRLWLVPNGAQATEGAYLAYPFADLVRLTALESWRHRCIVIGEDLGTVPAQCRVRLARAGILGIDVLAFMHDGAVFRPPSRWRRDAVAMTSTHDLAPLAGWWQERDLDWLRRLNLPGDAALERTRRARARAQLARALCIPQRSPPTRVVDAAVDFVAATPSPLAIVPLEDLGAATEQPNLPGTTALHPNWRRRYRASAERMLKDAGASARLRILARRRP